MLRVQFLTQILFLWSLILHIGCATTYKGELLLNQSLQYQTPEGVRMVSPGLYAAESKVAGSQIFFEFREFENAHEGVINLRDDLDDNESNIEKFYSSQDLQQPFDLQLYHRASETIDGPYTERVTCEYPEAEQDCGYHHDIASIDGTQNQYSCKEKVVMRSGSKNVQYNMHSKKEVFRLGFYVPSKTQEIGYFESSPEAHVKKVVDEGDCR